MLVEQQILDSVRRLSDEQREQVLAYVRSLTPQSPKGTPGHVLKAFVGRIAPEELDQMEQAIERDLGQVNPRAW